MSTPTITTTAAVKAPPTCPAWCAADHAADLTGVLWHRSAELREGPFYAQVMRREPLTAAHRAGGADALIYINYGYQQGVALARHQVDGMASTMSALGHDDAVRLLARASELLDADGGA